MRCRRLLAVATLVLLGLLLPAAAPLAGQFNGYFGRNKVQYESFDFQVLKTDHFDLYFYEEEREAATMAARMAERWYARLSRVLNHEFRQRQPIILYANHPHFEQTNATPQQIGESTGGFTEILKRRVVLPLAGPLKESDHVLGHELVHAFQFDITGQGTGGPGLDVPGAIRLPLWFIEGMAEYLSLGPVDPFTTMWLRDAVVHDDLPTISDLRNPRYFPYRYGHALWSYIAGRWGEQRIGRILTLAGRSGNAPAAIAAVLETSPDSLSAMWHQELRDYYQPVLEATAAPSEFGTKLLSEETTDANLNLGPALSPDGDEIVFLSERSLFSIDMFVADARTGEVRTKLTETAVDPHYESLQFIQSSGSYGPDGQRFVIAGVNRGQPIVTIIDPDDGDRLQEWRFPELGEIFAPAWSPDGRSIAFAAQVDGFLDLYVLDVETGQLRRLTNDAYADFQPSWSPDGRELAFVTDRFTTDLSLLTAGRYELARLDVSGTALEPRPLPRVPDPEADSWDPHWGPDGDIYFVSDHEGVRNVYRLDLGEERFYQLTNLQGGVSGIANLSPSLTVASRSGDLAVSIYEEGPFNYNIYRIDAQRARGGVPIPDRIASVDPAIIPPRIRASDELVALLRNPRLGLADPITFEEDDYSTNLSLDFIGQPTLALAASDFGVFFAGGASLYFSDMLGDVSLYTLFQVNTARGDVAKGTAALVGYENRSSRWNWGVAGGQIPFVTRFFQTGLVSDSVVVIRDFRFFQVDRSVNAALAYPLNRSQRFEVSVNARQLDFAVNIDTLAFNQFTFQIVGEGDEDVPTCAEGITDPRLELCSPSTLYLAGGSTALVYDNSIFGGTSPILGQRYRLEVAPTVGSLNFVNLLGDYRKYFQLARPLAFAVRGLHFGRYLPDGEDERLSEIFVGWSRLVRGYDIGSFEASECFTPGAEPITGGCPILDQLLGSRIGVFNAELRLPLLGGVGVVPAAGFPPIEIGTFFDAGVAWTSDLGPCFESAGPEDCREPVKSVGFLARLNLFGLAVAELDVVNPLDRPDQDWFVVFNLQPGF